VTAAVADSGISVVLVVDIEVLLRLSSDVTLLAF
jgi:hypothetical protein